MTTVNLFSPAIERQRRILSQPGATPQEITIQYGQGLKARSISIIHTDDGSGFQPLTYPVS